MARTKPEPQDRQTLLAMLPLGTERVKVRESSGKVRYKDPDLLADDDAILTKKGGKPIVMRESPGRKGAVTFDAANKKVAALMERKRKLIEGDRILAATHQDTEGGEVLQQVVQGLGEEAASLLFERMEAERKGEETSALSIRRINALKAIADTWLKRKDQLVARGIDLDSPGFAALFEFIMVTMQEAMQSTGVRGEMVEAVFAKFSSTVGDDSWKNEAKNRVKKAI